jgi:hypothetical protein
MSYLRCGAATVLAGSLAFAAACTDSATSSGSALDGGSDATAPLGDAGPTGDGAGLEGDAGVTDNVGAVFAISDTTTLGDGGTKSSHRAGANFRHISRADSTTITKTVGPCLVEIIGGGDEEQAEAKSAGAVQIEGGSKTVDLAPKADGTYAVSTGATALWGGGETLTVRAEGKDVPAFNTTLTAPARVTLTSPVVPGAGLTIKKSAGLTAKFAGPRGTVVLYFDAAAGTQAVAVTCTFNASAGTGEIPPAAFADFPSGGGTYDFYVKETATVAPAGWAVRVTASSAMVDSVGAALAGQATFE